MTNPLPPQSTQDQPDAPRRPSVPPPPAPIAGGPTPGTGQAVAEAFAPPDGRTATLTPVPPRGSGPGSAADAGGGRGTAPVAPRPPIVPLRGAAATAAVIESGRDGAESVPTDGTWEKSWGQFGNGAAAGAATGTWNTSPGPQAGTPAPPLVPGNTPGNASPNGKHATGDTSGNGGGSPQPGQWIVPSTPGSKAADPDAKGAAAWKKAEPTGKAEAKSLRVTLPFGLDRALGKLGLKAPTRQTLIRAGAVAVALLPVLVLLGVWVVRGGSTKSVEAQQADSFQTDDTSGMQSDDNDPDSSMAPDYQGGLGDPTSPRDSFGDPSTGSGSGSGSGYYGSSGSGSRNPGSGGSGGGGGSTPPPTPTSPPPTNPPGPTTPVVNPGEIGLTNQGGGIQWTILGVPKSSNPASVTAVTADRGGGCRSVATYQHTIELCFGPGAATVKSIQKNIAGNNVNFTCTSAGCNGQLMMWKIGLVGAPQVAMDGAVTTVVLDMGVTGASGHWYERIVIVDGNVAEVQHTIDLGFVAGSYKDATRFKAG